MKKYLNLIAALLALVISSCDSTDGPSGNNNNNDTLQIMPLKVGNSWTYRRDDIFDGTVTSSRNYTVRITAQSPVNGEIYYSADSLLGSYSAFLINKQDGLWQLNGSNLYQWAKYPSAVNAKYQKDTLIYYASDTTGGILFDTIAGQWQVKAVNAPVAVDDTIYSAYQYEIVYYFADKHHPANTEDSRVVTYYAPGVGLVLREYIFKDSGYTFILRHTLLSRSLN